MFFFSPPITTFRGFALPGRAPQPGYDARPPPNRPTVEAFLVEPEPEPAAPYEGPGASALPRERGPSAPRRHRRLHRRTEWFRELGRRFAVEAPPVMRADGGALRLEVQSRTQLAARCDEAELAGRLLRAEEALELLPLAMKKWRRGEVSPELATLPLQAPPAPYKASMVWGRDALCRRRI